METLFEKSAKKTRLTNMNFMRYLINDIDWNARLIGIKGARGTGKTTLLLQRIKLSKYPKNSALYISMDDIYFTSRKLVDLADIFVKNGGTHLFIDEVHKYENWSQELKNIYDDFSELHVIFTSSSALEIHKGTFDLSRRAHVYNLHELSFREYINLMYKTDFKPISLEDILNNHTEYCEKVNENLRPIALFNEYIKFGAYPFIKEGKSMYYERLESIVNLVLETDLPAIFNITYSTTTNLKKLLYIISKIVPFTPNITDLSKKVDTTRDLLLKYIHFLEKVNLIFPLRAKSIGTSRLTKPDKIFLNNTTLMYALGNSTNKGNIRETFFANQLSCRHKLTSTKFGDFKIDGKYTVEIGGKNKGFKQIKDIDNSFIAADDIEDGYKNKIPLWLFGFTY